MMAGPFFILAGEIPGGAKLSERIFGFFRAILSRAKGGYGFVCVGSSIIFAGISGSGAASIPCAWLNLTHNSGNAYPVPRREFTTKSKKSKK
jgi:TRAP-type C4-dicarboxylate transport system permease large subunit